MIPWAKMASDLDLDPAIIRAGRNGREVYLLLLRRCALGDSRGFISARHLDPGVIARILMCSVAEAQDGIDACLRESLVVTDVRDQRDGVTIVAWEKWNGSLKEPMSVTERKAKSRKLKKEREQVTKVTKVTEVTTEKSREEKKREEIPDSLSQAVPACDPPAPAPVAKGSAVHGTPGKIAQLVQHAIDRIDTARRQLDPQAQQLVSALRVGQPARDLMDRLMPIDERERRKVLDHVLDVVIAEAKADGVVDKLSLGFVAGERAWPMHVAATVGGSIRRPRSPPPVPPRRDPARGSVPARVDSHTDGTGIVRIEKEF